MRKFEYRVTTRVTTFRMSERDQVAVAGTKLWLESLSDMLRLSLRQVDAGEARRVEAPGWVRACSLTLEGTLFAPTNAALSECVFTPYRVGYALGLMRWGTEEMERPMTPEVKKLNKLAWIRLS